MDTDAQQSLFLILLGHQLDQSQLRQLTDKIPRVGSCCQPRRVRRYRHKRPCAPRRLQQQRHQMVCCIIRPSRINIETALPFLRIRARDARRHWSHNSQTHNHNIEPGAQLFNTCSQTFHVAIGRDVAGLAVHVDRRAQVGALRGDVGEGARAAGRKDEGRGASLGVGVGYGGANAPTGAEDANGEVGREVHGRGVDCGYGVIMLGFYEIEGVGLHGCRLVCSVW